MNNHFLTPRTQCTALLLIFISIFLVYMNTYQVSWHLDDFPNILSNSNLHLKDLGYQSIKKTFYSSFEGKTSLYRPVSCLTFALNWYFGKNSVQGFHAVNILFHFLKQLRRYLHDMVLRSQAKPCHWSKESGSMKGRVCLQ